MLAIPTCMQCGNVFRPRRSAQRFCSQSCFGVAKSKLRWPHFERLKALWIAGLSASQIAAQLGGGITRNAVIGKARRLGLSGRDKPPAAPRAPKQRKPPTLRFTRPAPRAAYEIEAATFTTDQDIPLAQRCQLLDFTADTCRWPVGDPGAKDFFFCGGETGGKTYCTAHARIAYTGRAHRLTREEFELRRLLNKRKETEVAG